MPYIDDTTPGLNTQISNWVLGDSREFQRTVTVALDVGDYVTDAYLTIKSKPTDIDANALVQVHVTASTTANGVVLSGNSLVLIVFGTQIAAAFAGPVYYYDITVVTFYGRRLTIETGQITYQQGTTQAQSGNSPAVLPNSGLPNFKGFASGPPTSSYNFGIYNVGDVFFTNQPTGPDGWRCVAPGSPGTWQALG